MNEHEMQKHMAALVSLGRLSELLRKVANDAREASMILGRLETAFRPLKLTSINSQALGETCPKVFEIAREIEEFSNSLGNSIIKRVREEIENTNT